MITCTHTHTHTHIYIERERELQSQPDSVEMKRFQTNHHEELHTPHLVLCGHVASPDKDFVMSAIRYIKNSSFHLQELLSH